jgi:hypothetical protein
MAADANYISLVCAESGEEIFISLLHASVPFGHGFSLARTLCIQLNCFVT